MRDFVIRKDHAAEKGRLHGRVQSDRVSVTMRVSPSHSKMEGMGVVQILAMSRLSYVM